MSMLKIHLLGFFLKLLTTLLLFSTHRYNSHANSITRKRAKVFAISENVHGSVSALTAVRLVFAV